MNSKFNLSKRQFIIITLFVMIVGLSSFFAYFTLNNKSFSDAAIVYGDNLVLNPSFEEPLANKYYFNGNGEINLNTVNKRTGQKAAQIHSAVTNGSSTLSTKAFTLAIESGQNYEASVFVLSNNIANKAELILDFGSSSNQIKIGSSSIISTGSTNNIWKELKTTQTAPAGADAVTLSVKLTGTGDVFIDDLSIRKVTEIIDNGGGGTSTTGLYPKFAGRYADLGNGGTPNVPEAAIVAAGGEENIPECPAVMHDPINWHPLYVPAELITDEMAALITTVDMKKTGCHYIHTHNANPAIGDSIFGKAGSLWGGQTLSYPWETINSSNMHENHVKHEGYKYIVEKDLPIGRDGTGLNFAPGNNNRITDARVQYHALGGPRDATVRLHSYYAEYKVCSAIDSSQCGIMKFGGWADYGIMHLPYKTTILPLPADPVPVNQTINEDPYRAHVTMADGEKFASQTDYNCKTKACSYDDGFRNHDIWWLWTTGPGRYGYNMIGGPMIYVNDDWQGINPSNPSQIKIACDPKTNPCRFNNTEHLPFTLWAKVDALLDGSSKDKDPRAKFVSLTGFTDKKGNIMDSCTEITADCIPVVMDKMPVGWGAWNSPASNGKWGDRWKDYDVSPGKVWWVQDQN